MNNETTEYPSMSMAVNKDDLIRQHREKIDELAAQNERLRERIAMCRHHANYSIGDSDALGLQLAMIRKISNEVLKETPPASLAHVRAEAIERMCHQWESEADDLPYQHECQTKGSSTYNWQKHYAKAGILYAQRIQQSAKQSGEER